MTTATLLIIWHFSLQRREKCRSESEVVATRGGRADGDLRPRARPARVVVPFPRADEGDRLELGRLVPSGRSLLLAFAVLGAAILSWVGARETSVFAVRTVAVEGAPAGVTHQVERTLRSAHGQSLLALDVADARRRVEALPTVAGVTFDRAYPHTLRVAVTPERVVAIVRQGASSFAVSDRGRVVARVERTKRPELARIWVTKDTPLEPGLVAEGELRTAVGAVSPLSSVRFPSRVASVKASQDELTLHLRSGIEVRMGDAADVDLKLAVAARVLPRLLPGSAYLDVSVPVRPVAGAITLDSQVEVEGSISTSP